MTFWAGAPLLDASAAPPERPTAAPAIVGGTLIDVADGRRVENALIVVDGNRIVQVGPAGSLSIPPGARQIDARGQWIVPGLMDMHAHASSEDTPLELYLAAGVTTIREPAGGKGITRERLLREAIDTGQVVGPRFFFCGPILDGRPPLWPDKYLMVDSARIATSTVNFLIDQGVDCIKIYNSISADVLPAIVEAANRSGVPVTGHVPRSLTMSQVVEMGVGQLEHIRITARELMPREEADRIDFLPYGQREPMVWDRVDLSSPAIERLITLLVEKRVVLDPTLSIDERLLVLDEASELAHPDNKILPPALREAWKGAWVSPNLVVPPELKEVAARGFEKRKRFVKICSDAGVHIVAGTDGPSLGTLLPGLGLHHELQLLVESGLTPLQALQAATINAAVAVRRKDLGRIAPNMLADLVVLTADPLVDIRNVGRIAAVVKDGRLYHEGKLRDVP